MRKWILVCVSFVMVSFSLSVWATGDHDYQTAQATIQNWFAAMKDDQLDKAASFLSPQFVSIHTDRIVRDKQQEMNLIKKLQMKQYLLSNFKFSRSGDAIVVTYFDQGAEKIDNEPIAPKAAGRMAVLQKKGDKWLILAYANLDRIG